MHSAKSPNRTGKQDTALRDLYIQGNSFFHITVMSLKLTVYIQNNISLINTTCYTRMYSIATMTDREKHKTKQTGQ